MQYFIFDNQKKALILQAFLRLFLNYFLFNLWNLIPIFFISTEFMPSFKTILNAKAKINSAKCPQNHQNGIIICQLF